MVDKTTIEQRISYFHLLKEVIEHKVTGEVVELGTFTGNSAMLF
jgi:O-methyltransferase